VKRIEEEEIGGGEGRGCRDENEGATTGDETTDKVSGSLAEGYGGYGSEYGSRRKKGGYGVGGRGGDWKVVASARKAGVDPLDNCVDGTFESSFSGALRDGTAADGFVGGPRCAYRTFVLLCSRYFYVHTYHRQATYRWKALVNASIMRLCGLHKTVWFRR